MNVTMERGNVYWRRSQSCERAPPKYISLNCFENDVPIKAVVCSMNAKFVAVRVSSLSKTKTKWPPLSSKRDSIAVEELVVGLSLNMESMDVDKVEPIATLGILEVDPHYHPQASTSPLDILSTKEEMGMGKPSDLAPPTQPSTKPLSSPLHSLQLMLVPHWAQNQMTSIFSLPTTRNILSGIHTWKLEE